MIFPSHLYLWQRGCLLHFTIFSEIIFFFFSCSIGKIIWCWKKKYESEDLEVIAKWVRRIACHLSWAPCSCKDPVQQMQLFRLALSCHFSSSTSLKKCHWLLWSSILGKNRVLFNWNQVALHNCLLTIAKWSKGKLCVLIIVLAAVFTAYASSSHCSLVVPASIDSSFTNLVLIHQNSPGVKRQGSSRIFFALFVSLFSLQVEEFMSRVYPLERKEGNKSEHLEAKGSFNSLFSQVYWTELQGCGQQAL